MKTEELMIGDYVQIEYRSKKVKVTAVHDKCIGTNAITPLLADEFKPIPLTPEILYKNGFKDTDIVIVGTRKLRWTSDDERTEITIWMDETLPMEIVKNVYYEDEVCYTLPFPGTVHELQHALRLCKIGKEIIL